MRKATAAAVLVCLAASLPAWGQALLSVEPGQGEAGTTLEITVTGEPGIWFFDFSYLTFDPAQDKITHDALVAQDSNVFTTNITIAPDTPSGLQTVTLYSEEYAFVGENLFEVTGGTASARILSVSPSSGAAGASLSLTVTGEGTSFSSASLLEFSPGGIQVGSLTAQSATVLQAQVTIDAGASLGSRNVSVTTGAEVASGDGLFSVTEPAVNLDPDSGVQGETLASLTITGGPGGYSAQTGVDLGEGISAGTVAGSGNTLTLSDVVIAADAPVGLHDLILTNPVFSASAVFLVEQGPDTQLLSVTPAHGDRGHPGLPVTLLGQNTHFDEEDLAVGFSDSSIRATDLSGTDPTNLEAVLIIGEQAAEGTVDVTVSLGAQADCTTCERVTLADGFEVTAPGSLDSADPWILEAGETPSVAFAASDGQFLDGQTVLMFEPPDGIEVLNLTVQDADHLTAELQVDAEAPGDPRDVIAVSGSEVALGPGLVDVYHPELRRATPSTAFRNTSPSVTITGVDVPFDAGSQVEFSGAGISVSAVTFDPEMPNQIVADINVAADAPLEIRDITVTTAVLQVTGVGLFEVVEMAQKEEDQGCTCGSRSAPFSGLGLGLGLVLLGWIRRRRR